MSKDMRFAKWHSPDGDTAKMIYPTTGTSGTDHAFAAKMSSILPDCPTCKHGSLANHIMAPFIICSDCNTVFEKAGNSWQRVHFMGKTKFQIRNGKYIGPQLDHTSRQMLVFFALKWAKREVILPKEIITAYVLTHEPKAVKSKTAVMWFDKMIATLVKRGFITNMRVCWNMVFSCDKDVEALLSAAQGAGNGRKK